MGRVACVIGFLTLVLAMPAGAATRTPPPLPATPQAFVDQLKTLYDPHRNTTEEDPNWWQWHKRLYDPEFTRLIDENQSFGPLVQGIVDVDYDPLCGCQDTVGPIRKSSMTPRPDGTVEVDIGNRCSDDRSGEIIWPSDCSHLIIKRIRGAWRLYDVLTPASLRQRLVLHNTCLRKAKTTEAANRCIEP